LAIYFTLRLTVGVGPSWGLCGGLGSEQDQNDFYKKCSGGHNTAF